MNKKTLLILILVFQSFSFYAQGPVRDKIKTLKVAFITERLALTSGEAQSFWPVYNEHEKKLEAIRRKERFQLRSQIGMIQDLSEKESSALLSEFLNIQEEKHLAERAMITDLKSVLPPKKILLLLKAEEDFKKRLLQQYRKRQGGG